jgi:hypothetical protein
MCEDALPRNDQHGDPDETGQFGVCDCIGQVRSWNYEAVIGIGGTAAEARSYGIDGRVTSVPHWLYASSLDSRFNRRPPRWATSACCKWSSEPRN